MDLQTEMEKCDEQLLRLVLECPRTTPKEMLYLELGVTPIRYIIMSRRIMFYHYILNENKESLIYKFYKVQAKKPVKNDWSLTVKNNLEELEISLTEDEIENLSTYSFQKIVKPAIQKAAFSYLNNLKNDHTKVLHIPYEKLEIQDYLLPSSVSAEAAKFAFLCRSRMVQVGETFKQGRNSTVCPLCKNDSESDSQQHLMKCVKLNQNDVVDEYIPAYDDLFSRNLEKKRIIVEILRKKLKERKKILDQT